MARLAADARRAGHRPPGWWSEAEATHRFRFDGATRWIRPDAAGVYYLGQEERPFLLEYDRGTMRRRDYMRKLVGLVAFFEAELDEEFYGAGLTLLVSPSRRAVSSDSGRRSAPPSIAPASWSRRCSPPPG